MKRVLILFHFKDWMAVQLVAKDLERIGKEVLLWTVESTDKTVVNEIIPMRIRVLSKEDFATFTCLTSNALNEFKNLEYDTLIDFSQDNGEGIEYLSYLLAINTAEFCIGNREREENVYDMIVFQMKDKGILETFEQMKTYLTNIIP